MFQELLHLIIHTNFIKYFYRVPKNQRLLVYGTVMKHGDDKNWDLLWEQYKSSNIATERILILKALACSKNTTKLEESVI